MWLWWSKTPNRRKVMLKNRLIAKFKEKFGGNFIKENGRVYWSKDDHKELVTSGFLLYYLNNEDKLPGGKKKVEPVKPIKVEKPEVVVQEEKPKVIKKAPVVKKNEPKTESNSELPEGS